MKKNVITIMGAQAGSEGKSKVISEYAIRKNPEVAISNNMPNSGHTVVINGRKRIFRILPVSCVNKNTQLFLGSGTVVDEALLRKELEENADILDGRIIIAHPLIGLIEERHIAAEKANNRTGTTFKGCGEVIAEKVRRDPKLRYLQSFKNVIVSQRYDEILNNHLDNSNLAILEGSQGCDLSLNGEYNPYVTSRDINIASMYKDAGITPFRNKETIMVVRLFPIRISNESEVGYVYSGDYGRGKGNELTWSHINAGAALGQYPTAIGIPSDNYDFSIDDLEAERLEAMRQYRQRMGNEYVICPEYYSSVLGRNIRNYSEITTVTKRERRVFDIDIERLKKNIRDSAPVNSIYLNFFQHLNTDFENIHGNYDKLAINKYQKEYINWLETETGIPVIALGTGPDIKDTIKRQVKRR